MGVKVRVFIKICQSLEATLKTSKLLKFDSNLSISVYFYIFSKLCFYFFLNTFPFIIPVDFHPGSELGSSRKD